jgi:hypothetical protein
MSETNTSPAPVLHTDNILGSLGSTIAGIGIAAPAIANDLSHIHLPSSFSEWLQIGLGILAIFARG